MAEDATTISLVLGSGGARAHGCRLLDGALVNPVPIAPALTDSTDLTVAVNPSGRAD